MLSVPLGGGTYRSPSFCERLDRVEVANTCCGTGRGGRRIERVDTAYDSTIDDEESLVPFGNSMCSERTN